MQTQRSRMFVEIAQDVRRIEESNHRHARCDIDGIDVVAVDERIVGCRRQRSGVVVVRAEQIGFIVQHRIETLNRFGIDRHAAQGLFQMITENVIFEFGNVKEWLGLSRLDDLRETTKVTASEGPSRT